MSKQRESKIFVDGVYANSSASNTGKIKISLDIADVERFISFLNQHKKTRTDGKVFLQLWEKKEHNKYGTHDLTLDTWRMENVGKNNRQPSREQGATKFTDESDLPFK